MGIPGRMALLRNPSWFLLVGGYNYCMPIIMVISQKSARGRPWRLVTPCIQLLLLLLLLLFFFFNKETDD